MSHAASTVSPAALTSDTTAAAHTTITAAEAQVEQCAENACRTLLCKCLILCGADLAVEKVWC
jgi:hypothetical protein